MIDPALFHPMVVHFPIVLFLSLAAFDIIVVVRGLPLGGRQAIANVSAALAVLAGAAAVVTAYFGDMAYDTAISRGFPEARLDTHQGLGVTTAICFGIWALVRAYLWWRSRPVSKRLAQGFVAVEIVGVLLIVTTAYFGGRLVYDMGVNVGPVVASMHAHTVPGS